MRLESDDLLPALGVALSTEGRVGKVSENYYQICVGLVIDQRSDDMT
jgi:hypothetical protein